MADTARNQGTVLEIPVTIQGSKTVEGSDQRELFTETTKTTLVFENGAVLKLNAKISPGQCVFLRNDQTEKEILCKVRESRQAGEVGYTDLEFTSYDPQFWSAEKLAPAGDPLTAQDILEATVKNPTAAPIMESLMESIAPIGAEVPVHADQPAAPTTESIAPTSGGNSATVPETPATPEGPATAFASPLPITLEAAHESLTAVRKHEPTDEELDWNEAKDADLVAALAAMEGKAKAPREPDTRETKEPGQQAAAADAKKQGEKSSNTAREAKVLSTPAPRIGRLGQFTQGKKTIVIGIAAAIVIAAALGVAWLARSGFSTNSSNRTLAASHQPKQATAPLSPTQVPVVANSANNGGAAPAQATQKTQQTTEAQGAAATTAGVRAAPVSKGVEDSDGSGTPKVGADKSSASSDQAASAHATRRKPNEINAGENVPAKIVSQEPPSIPAWTTGLEADEVVKLDALIDEKGNVVETKLISGPRILQHEAERAVALWVFEPALSDGKPIATRMVLTVQFQN
jgi:hypothetical protein